MGSLANHTCALMPFNVVFIHPHDKTKDTSDAWDGHFKC